MDAGGKMKKKFVVMIAMLGLVGAFWYAISQNVNAEINVVETSNVKLVDAQKNRKILDEAIESNKDTKVELDEYAKVLDKFFDPIYMSMNLPSETRSDEMIRSWRDKGYIMSEMQEEHSTILGIGAIYKTSGAELPDTFTLCLGKMKTFAYLKSINNWVLIDESPYPRGVYLYKLPWTEHSWKKCENVEKYEDHVEISLTAEEYEGYVLHFWGKLEPVDRADVLYVACAYDFWIKEPGYDGVFTATIGVDAKDSEGSQKSIKQLFTGRGLSVMSNCRTQWGHSIPNDEYDSVRDGITLRALYEKRWDILRGKE